MATKTSQRVGIWIIAGALILGTLASFIVMIIAPQNDAKDSERLQKVYADFQEKQTAYQEKTEAQQNELEKDTAKLSEQYYQQLAGYKENNVKKYDPGEAQKKLTTNDLKKGDGKEIGDDSTYAAYYIGWLPNGNVFDGSIDGKKLKTPLIVRPSGVIEGWTEGVKGMKIGGARVISIPAEKAYGNASQGDIPANSPLKFIVMPVRSFETIEQPPVPTELEGLYG